MLTTCWLQYCGEAQHLHWGKVSRHGRVVSYTLHLKHERKKSFAVGVSKPHWQKWSSVSRSEIKTGNKADYESTCFHNHVVQSSTVSSTDDLHYCYVVLTPDIRSLLCTRLVLAPTTWLYATGGLKLSEFILIYLGTIWNGFILCHSLSQVFL